MSGRIAIVLVIILVFLLTGCAGNRPDATHAQPTVEIDLNAPPAASSTSTNGGGALASPLAPGISSDFTTVQYDTTVMINGGFSIVLPAGSKYYCSYDMGTKRGTFMGRYGNAGVVITQIWAMPEDISKLTGSRVSTGTETYNGMSFPYTYMKDLESTEYYFKANTGDFAIRFDAREGAKDIKKEISTIMNSWKLLDVQSPSPQ